MAREAAKRWNAHVILKGARTVLASPDGHTFVNTTGNAGLAKVARGTSSPVCSPRLRDSSKRTIGCELWASASTFMVQRRT